MEPETESHRGGSPRLTTLKALAVKTPVSIGLRGPRAGAEKGRAVETPEAVNPGAPKKSCTSKQPRLAAGKHRRSPKFCGVDWHELRLVIAVAAASVERAVALKSIDGKIKQSLPESVCEWVCVGGGH